MSLLINRIFGFGYLIFLKSVLDTDNLKEIGLHITTKKEILNDYNKIAASGDGTSGNGDIAIKIYEIGDANVLNGSKLGDIYSTLIGEVGSNVQNAERMAEIGFKDFSPPFKNTCENHGGSGLAAVQQWDAKTKSWSMITDYMGSDRAIIDKLIAEDSNKYAAEQKIAERCN